MEINKVRIGDFSIGAKGASPEKKEVQDEAKKEQVKAEAREVEAGFSDALNIAGLQNKVQINRVDKKDINPADYLSEDRIADIEAMMGKFSSGVDKIADAIELELPGFFAADVKNALAAKIYAAE